MYKLLVIITFTGLLSSGAESFKISQKDLENIDRILEFGFQVFLNCLDKVKEATEKMVKDGMLRTNRIAVQNHWNSFKETANRISVEERGNGVKDDLIVAARTVQRLALYYKDDVKKIFYAIAVEQNVPLYLPVVNIFKGSIERAKINDIWSTLATSYFPDAPPIESDPMEFLCYLLSTSTVETFTVNVLKAGAEVITEYNKIDFEKVNKRAMEILDTVVDKFIEIKRIEEEGENDDFILFASVTSRVLVFYWETFLNYTDNPLLEEKFENITRRLNEERFGGELYEALRPIMESETLKDIWRLHFEFAKEVYELVSASMFVFFYSGSERTVRTLRALNMVIVVQSYSIFEKLSEMGVLPKMEQICLKAVHIVTALADTEEFQYFRETVIENWITFRKEINTRVEEERRKSQVFIPQVQAITRMLLEKFVNFLDTVNTDIDDDTVRALSMRWANMRELCIKKLLASGVLTQNQVDEAQRIFREDVLGFFSKYKELTEGIDTKRAEEILKGLVKTLLVGYNYIFAPLTEAWNFVAD